MMPVTDDMPCLAMNPWAGQPPWHVVPSSEEGEGDEWAAYVVLDTYNEDVPRDHLQGASPRVRSAHGSRRSHDRPRGPGKPEQGRRGTGDHDTQAGRAA
jgi:hypothetical protein